MSLGAGCSLRSASGKAIPFSLKKRWNCYYSDRRFAGRFFVEFLRRKQLYNDRSHHSHTDSTFDAVAFAAEFSLDAAGGDYLVAFDQSFAGAYGR